MTVYIALGILGTLIIGHIIEKLISKNIENNRLLLEKQKIQFEERELFKKYKDEVHELYNSIFKEKTIGFPWLSTALADIYENYDLLFANYLETKVRPAHAQSRNVKEIAREKKLFKKEAQVAKYIIEYYESLFPWLQEYVGFDSDELIKSVYSDNYSEEDPVAFYITKSEYENLSTTERNQRALDRYWNRDKDPWQIGRDYERYIGYLYEIKGFKVHYHGIEKIKEDLGRDLICAKGDNIQIVQCKYWSNNKAIPIRENHITQLYGTTIKYFLDFNKSFKNTQLSLFPDILKDNKISPVLIATTELSETAKEFAEILKITVHKIPMDKNYPCIKCNINKQTNERIYHLPFDQQYDHTQIELSKGEMWARTVLEAENNGYRRAYRWNPSKE